MGRYNNELFYDLKTNVGEIRKAMTLRIIDSKYEKALASVHIVKEGENLFTISTLYYNDFRKWYHIADKNPSITNPFNLVNGTELVIPNIDGSDN